MSSEPDNNEFEIVSCELAPKSQSEIAKAGLKKFRLVFNNHCEKFGPYIASLFAGVVCFLCWPNELDKYYSKVLLETLPVAISVAAVLSGIQIATPAILISIPNSDVMQALKKGGHYEKIVRFIHSSVLFTGAFIIVAVSCLVILSVGDEMLFFLNLSPRLICSLLLFIFVLSISLSYRLVSVLLFLLKTDHDSSSAKGSNGLN